MSSVTEKKGRRVRYQHELIAQGELNSNLHYGPFASQWWDTSGRELIPLRLNMLTRSLINSKTESRQIIDLYITREDESVLPLYRAICKGIDNTTADATVSALSTSKAINDCLGLYSHLNGIHLSGTKLPGPEFIGLGVENIETQLRKDVEMEPVLIIVQSLHIFVTSLPLRLFTSSFFGKSHQGKVFYVQKIQTLTYQLEIYSEDGNLKSTFTGHSATEVWSQA